MADITQSPKYAQFRQYISQYVGGVNADALINTFADEAQRREQLSIAVTNQLTISTASGIYLQKLLAQKGITIPGDVGMSDDAFSKMGIQVNAIKQIPFIVNSVLETFYGPQATRANTISGQAEPYFFNPGDDLIVSVDNGKQYTITVQPSNFQNIQAATAAEVSTVITQFFASLNLNAYAQVYNDVNTALNYVQIFGGAVGPYSFLQIVGGAMQNEMEFPIIRNTSLLVNDTVWEITRPETSTYRFRWVSGSRPLLENVFIGDSVMIYGSGFGNLGIRGTFPITNLRPAEAGISLTAGWFETTIPGLTILYSSPRNQVPPINTPPIFYSYTVAQTSYYDLDFFLPNNNTAGSQIRYALGWEPDQALLKVYMPATTEVVQRGLIGAWHVHELYPATSLNRLYGSLTNQAEQIQITSQYSFTVPMIGFDNFATGGTISYGIGPTVVDVDYVRRENNTLEVFTVTPHGLTGTADAYGRVLSTEIVTLTVGNQPADDPINTFLGSYVVDPTANYTLTSTQLTLNEDIIQGQNPGTLFAEGVLPAAGGILMFDLGYENQEGPVPYIASQTAGQAAAVDINTISQNGFTVTVTLDGPSGAVPGSQVVIAGTANFNGLHTVATVPSPTTYTYQAGASGVHFEAVGSSTLVPTGNTSTIVLDPAYLFKQPHTVGANITLLSAATAYTPAVNGSDYSDYVTGIAEATAYAQSIIELITALGINLEIIIVYPDDIGLGNAGDGTLPTSSPKSDAVEIWGV